MPRPSLLPAALVALAMASPAVSQTGTGGTISHNDAFFTQADSPTINTGTGACCTAAFRVNGAAGTDNTYQHWWWLRIVSGGSGAETREYCLANSTGATWSGREGTVNFTTANYGAVIRYTVTGGPTGSNMGQVTARLVVTNLTGGPLQLAVFSYLDYDLAGTSPGDSAVLQGPSRIRITDGATFGEFYGPGSTAYRVTAFATLQGALADAAVTTLDNSGLPFASGDWTGAFQYAVSLAGNGSAATVTSVFSINQAATVPCPADYDHSGVVDPADISLFVSTWFNDLNSGTTVADFDGNGTIQPADISAFVTAWFNALTSGC